MGASDDCSVSPKSESRPFEAMSRASMDSGATEPSAHRNSVDALSPSKARLFTRTRSPPRNTKDQIYCDHEECSTQELIFARKCEWDKHMDKHERPYKCAERGCERLLGFTYSGGLLRHQREVHKINTSTKKALYCPFPHCNRSESSGNGFTRLENLNEHKRRRHTGEALLSSSGFTPILVRPNMTTDVPPAAPTQNIAMPTQSSGVKRRRRDVSDEMYSSGSENETDQLSPDFQQNTEKTGGWSREEELQVIIKQLRYENSEQEAEIQRLRKEIRDLRSLPPPVHGHTDVP